MRILLIDDSAEIEVLIRLALKKNASIDFVWQQTGLAATERLTKEKFDLLLLDFHLDGETGEDVLINLTEKISSLPPVIFITGTEDTGRLEALVALGVIGFIPKPFNPKTLHDQMMLMYESAKWNRQK